MSDNTAPQTAEAKRKKAPRSPAYPSLSLKEAIAKAQALYEREGKYPAPMPSAFSAWGYGAKSSGARGIRASLKYFGLISIDGDNETGKVVLTEDALRVLLDKREDETEKKAIIHRMALSPSIYKTLYEKFPDGIKSTASARHFLVFDEGYNESAAAELLVAFMETADYAGFFQPATVVDKAKVPEPEKRDIAVGDLVRVEIGGVVREERARVRQITEDQGAKWYFVDGSESGLTMEQVKLTEKGAEGTPVPPLNQPPKLPLSVGVAVPRPGEQEWLRGPLGSGIGYRLMVTGEMGPKEIGKLIRVLRAQQAVLQDDDENEEQGRE